MTTIGIAFLLAYILAVVATRLVMVAARRLGVVDRPDGYRKLHLRETPRLGGVAIFIAAATPILALFLLNRLSTVSHVLVHSGRELMGLLVGASMALGLGVLDDVLDLRPRWKVFWQILIASVAFAFGFSIEAISNPFGKPLYLGILTYPVSVFWFVGCMNAVNLLDGLDGLAAGTCLFVGMTLFLVSLHFNNVLAMLLMASLSGAVLGFLFFNFPPAKIFLGDSGSMLLGFLIAAFSLVGTSRKAEAAVALFVPIVALGLPILDTSMAILRRWYKRLPISAPDRQHIHHVMLSMGYSQQRAVLTLYAICLALGGAALLITFARSEIVIFVIGSLVVTAFVCIRLFSGVRLVDVLDKLSQDTSRNQRSFGARVLVERATQRMGTAPSLDDIWNACTEVFEGLELDSAELVLFPERARVETRAWHPPGEHNPVAGRHPDGWSSKLGLRWGPEVLGELVVAQNARDGLPVLEMPDLLNRLREAVTAQVARLWGRPPPPEPASSRWNGNHNKRPGLPHD
ncbi:MAG: MraY family glycosyltransferase [Verrucomicrobiota bacterium]